MLTVENLSVRYGRRAAVDGVSFSLQEGQWLMLVGPNGAGKSSLLRAVAQGVPYSGRVLLDGRDVRALRPEERARQIGALSQQNSVNYAYTVEEIVQLGRYAHARGFFSARDDGGAAQVARALEAVGMESMRHVSALTLSGGELQRAFLAQVFAQDPSILLLDEPANHLDLAYQKHIFSLVSEWVARPGRAVVSVVHDLSLARAHGSHALLMSEGRCLAWGEMADVLTPDMLRTAYGMDVYAWMRAMLRQWDE